MATPKKTTGAAKPAAAKKPAAAAKRPAAGAAKKPAAAGAKKRATSVKRGGGSRAYMKDFAGGRENLFCQSCGYNMRRDPDFGTEKNGAMTDRYCSGCYQDGKFAEDVKTPEEFINAAVVRIATQRKQAVGKTRLDLKKELPRLPRWS